MTNRIHDPAAAARIALLRNRVWQWMKDVQSPMLEGFERTAAAKGSPRIGD